MSAQSQVLTLVASLGALVVGDLVVPAVVHRKTRMPDSYDENPFEQFRFVGSLDRRQREVGCGTRKGCALRGSLDAEPCRKRPLAFSVHMGVSPEKKASSGSRKSRGIVRGDESKKSKKGAKAKMSKPPALPNFDGWLPVYEVGADGEGLHSEILPVVAGTPGGWRERWAGVCDDCFQGGIQCSHYPELPLRLLIIGHNPSEKTWEVSKKAPPYRSLVLPWYSSTNSSAVVVELDRNAH